MPAHSGTHREGSADGVWQRGGVIHFGKYELLSRINIGGMAEIVKARDTSAPDQPVVAVKRILPHLCEDAQYKTMFLDESRVLAQLDHEDIIKTFEIGEVEGTPYIALEYIYGQDARHLFHRTRRNDERVPIPIACYILEKVCEGLHHAHEQTDAQGELLGLVHRDVSLQNVLLSYDGDVKITDFGIAMSSENRARTEAGIVKGKFGYMSPEQIKGAPLDRRSDVFAAGICLYELLTGERLFSGESDYKAVERVRNVDVAPPSSLNREIPSTLERIVMKALAKQPRDRYQSANDLRRALQTFVVESGELTGKTELSNYLRRVFADELKSEPPPFDETPTPTPPRPSQAPPAVAAKGPTTIPAPVAPAAARSNSLAPPNPSLVQPPVQRRPPVDAATGLAAFDNLDPVSTLNLLPEPVDVDSSDVHELPAPYAAQMPAQRPPSSQAAVEIGSKLRAPSVPPIVPRDASIPGLPAAAFAAQSEFTDEPPAAAAALDMDWDEDEHITQSLGMEGVSPVPEPGDDDVTRQVRVDETFPGLRANADESGAFPPTLGLPATATKPVAQASLAGAQAAATVPPQVFEQRSLLPVVFVVVGIVAVIAAALYATREPGRATIRLTTEPRDAVVLLDGKPVDASSSPFLISGVKAEVPHTLRVEKSGHSGWSTRLTVHADQVLDLPAVTLEPQAGAVPAPPPPPTAAAVLAESAPPTATRSLPARRPEPRPAPGPRATAARHAATPAAPSHFRASGPAQTQPASAPTQKVARAGAASGAKGTLRINTRPWSQVFVDGKLIGNTPQMNILLPAGSHKVKLVNAQFKITKTLSVDITPGQMVTKVLTLQD